MLSQHHVSLQGRAPFSGLSSDKRKAFSSVRLAGSLLLACAGAAFAQVPTGAVASAAVEVSRVVAGRIVQCPAALNVTSEAVCLLATGTVESFKPRIKTRLGDRVLVDWQTQPGGRSANLLFKSGDAVTYVLLAQIKGEVLAIVDSPNTNKTGAATTGRATGTATTGTGATAPAAGAAGNVSYVPATALSNVLGVNVTGNVVTFARPTQNLILTVGNKSGRLNGSTQTLAGAPFAQGGQVYVPVTALRSLGCAVNTAATRGQVNVVCGTRNAIVSTVVR